MADDRTCPGCAMNDDHPRHQLVLGEGGQVAWHMDCHALKGCEQCQVARDGAGDLTGDDFRTFLEEHAEEIAAAVDAFTDEQKATAFGTAG
ncbi:hypothetical protein ACWEOE_28825 [Amycolatopsis sp. NPDC004368]